MSRVEISQNKLIEYFDLIILGTSQEDDINPSKFIFQKKLDQYSMEDKVFGLNLVPNLSEWAAKREFIKIYPNGNWTLTNKGIEVREKGGYKKYIDSLEQKPDAWRKTEVISAVCATIISLVSLYLSWKTNDELSSLKDKVEANSRSQAQFDIQVDSLENELRSLNSKMLSDSIPR